MPSGISQSPRRPSSDTPAKYKKIRRRVVLVALMDELPAELLQVVLQFRANSYLFQETLSEDLALQGRVRRRSFLWRCCLVSKRWQAAAEPILYADVCLCPLSATDRSNGRFQTSATEKGRYSSYIRAVSRRPARRAMLRSVEMSAMGLDVVFLKRTYDFPNLRALGTVCWPEMVRPKAEPKLVDESEWHYIKFCLDKDQQRLVAGIERAQFLQTLQQVGSVPSELLDGSTPALSYKPPLHRLALTVSPFATAAHNSVGSLEHWFDLTPLHVLHIWGKHHAAILPRLVHVAAPSALVDLRLEGYSASALSEADILAMLDVVGPTLETLFLMPLEEIANLVTTGHETLKTLYLGVQNGAITHMLSKSAPALLAALARATILFDCLTTIGFWQLNFTDSVQRCRTGAVNDLGWKVRRCGWTLVDRWGEQWQDGWYDEDVDALSWDI